MREHQKLPFFTLLLMISFASVNAVLFTPALPNIATFFLIPESIAQQTITWFLIGYAIGQLFYGPLANRFGRKPAIYTGIMIQILSSLLCVLAGDFHMFHLLLIGRFLMALGSGVGLSITFTLVNETYDISTASKKVSHLLLAFAITPGLGVALGGVLNTHFGWTSCFYAGAVYGFLLLLLTRRLPETLTTLNVHAFKIKPLINAYLSQIQNRTLIMGGLLMGSCTAIIYIFADIVPFIAIDIFQMTSAQYGFANILPPVGLIAGSLIGAHLINQYALSSIMLMGSWIALAGVIAMLLLISLKLPVIVSIFIPVIIIYFGLCFIISNASSLAMRNSTDKANASAMMSFINMGTATLIVLGISFLKITPMLLPLSYIGLVLFILLIIRCL